MKKRILSVIFCICISITLLPTSIFAEEDNVGILVRHIEENGSVDAARGYKYISNDLVVGKATIYYMKSQNCLDFYFEFYGNISSFDNLKQSMHFLYDIDTCNAKGPLYYKWSTEILEFECMANFDISTYGRETPIKFEKVNNPIYTFFPDEKEYNEDGNTCLKFATTGWNLLLMTKLSGMSLKDIGFVKYGTAQSETPSNPPSILAAGECGNNLTWSLNSNGVLTISGTGAMNNYTLRTAPWYNYYANIKTISIGNGVTNIGDYAFYGCNELTNITISNSVVSIGKNAFWSCKKLKNVALPSNLANIGARAFDTCSSIESIVIPSSVTTIGKFAFNNCYALRSATIQNGVRSIESAAFINCTNLSSIVIPDSVHELGTSAFEGCTLLENVTLSKNVSRISSSAFEGCTSLKLITIPEGITGIGSGEYLGEVFFNCTNLNIIYLPSSLREIGPDSFKNCASLKTVYFSGTQTQWNQIAIADGNQDLTRITPIFNGSDTPNPPTDPNPPVQPTNPKTLSLSVSNGGLGKKVTVQIDGGHWLTVQTRRAGSVALSSIQAPGSGRVTLAFSAAAGSSIQVWETEAEMTFNSQGVPNNKILASANRTL